MRPPTRRSVLGTVGAALAGLSGCFGDPDAGADDSPDPDEDLPPDEAVEYVLDFAASEWADRDDEALELYDDGVTAFRDENYSRAIRDLELSFDIYGELNQEAFEKRNEFDEDQHRWELFDLAWNLYRLMEESTASWYNAAYAVQVDDDYLAALEWAERAEDHYDQARRVATEYNELLDEWGNEDG